jgi:hypothetical protein
MPERRPTAPEAAAATPARRLDLPIADGCRVLPGGQGSWADGGEAHIAAILRDATDLSSASEELARHRDGWIERYNLSPDRANVVRALAIEPGAVVLEIGAGCGPVTRHLGERAAAVDALEPTPVRAAIARARTRDLPNVEVFAGGVDALPAEPAYDLIVVVGVLEYVGGAAGPAPRVEFLRKLAALLNDGGAVVCAIENQLGVKYLAGAPEDHSGVPFEGLEGFPRRGPFRTFARRDLERMFADAGLEPEVLHAFPDYKLPRLIYSDALLEGATAPMAWRGARFPSPDAPLPRARLADEERLWRSLVRAGLGGELANSFVVIGRSGAGSPWPEDLRAVFWSAGRRPRFTTATRIVAAGDGGAWLERSYAGDGPRAGDGLRHACVGGPYRTGTPLLEILEDADALAPWLRRWRPEAERAAAADPERGTNIDVGPQNVIVDGDELATVDEEWWHAGYSVADALDRSLLYATFALANARPPSRWPRCGTVADVHAELYRGAGLEPPAPERLAAIVEREAELQAQIRDRDPGEAQIRDRDPGEPDWDATVAAHRDDLTAFLARPLEETMLGRREHDAALAHAAQGSALERVQRAYERTARELEQRDAALATSDAAVDELLARLGEANRELAALEQAHRDVVGSKAWRYTQALLRRGGGRRRC